MPDKKDLPIKEESKVTRPDVYSQIHDHSFRELATKLHQEPVKEEEKPEVKNKVEEKVEEVKEKKAVEKKEKLTEEITQKVTDKLVAEQKIKEEIVKKAETEVKEQEELDKKENYQPIWKTDPDHPKDEKGNRIPKSYDEIFSEAAKAAESRMEAKLIKQEKAKAEIETKKQTEETQTREQHDAADRQLSQQLEEEYDDLIATDKMPKITDPNNAEDEGVKAKIALFKKGMEYNTERLKEGKRPVTSIKLIYYEQFKPAENGGQPAGGDAPVAGVTPSNVTTTTKEENIPYKQLHNMSFREIFSNAMKKVNK